MRKGKAKIFCLLVAIIFSLNIYPHVNKQPEGLYNPGINICNGGYEEVELPPPPPRPEFH